MKVDCGFVKNLCVLSLVKAHHHLILSNAKELIQEKGANTSAKFSV